jgi:CheY-like chemotaxis protein
MSTVLVVDDDPDTCLLLQTYLGLAGFNVLTASNGRDALTQLAETRPSVILLDLMMPIMDGVEFRRRQQRDIRLRDIPVVCLSARHDARQTAAQLGFTEFISKPFELEALGAAVRRHCAS